MGVQEVQLLQLWLVRLFREMGLQFCRLPKLPITRQRTKFRELLNCCEDSELPCAAPLMNPVSRFETTAESRKRCKISSQQDKQQFETWRQMEPTKLTFFIEHSRLELYSDKLGQHSGRQNTVARRQPRVVSKGMN